MNNNQGFTIIELLLAIIIISILSAILIPNLINFRQKTNDSAALAIANRVINAMAAIEAGNAFGGIVTQCSLSNSVVSFTVSNGSNDIKVSAPSPANSVACSEVPASGGSATKYKVQVDYIGGTTASKVLIAEK